MKEQGRRSDLGDNITEVTQAKGTSKAYTLSRLERESPELFQQACEGGSISQCIAVQEARENPAMGWGGDRSKDTDKQGDNVTLKERGNSSEYTLRRLARDGHDELLDQIEAGEISVNKTLYLPRVFRLLLSEQTQRETVAGKLATLERGDVGNGRKADGPNGPPTTEQAAEQLNVKVRNVKRAKVAIKGGCQELVEAMSQARNAVGQLAHPQRPSRDVGEASTEQDRRQAGASDEGAIGKC